MYVERQLIYIYYEIKVCFFIIVFLCHNTFLYRQEDDVSKCKKHFNNLTV